MRPADGKRGERRGDGEKADARCSFRAVQSVDHTGWNSSIKIDNGARLPSREFSSCRSHQKRGKRKRRRKEKKRKKERKEKGPKKRKKEKGRKAKQNVMPPSQKSEVTDQKSEVRGHR